MNNFLKCFSYKDFVEPLSVSWIMSSLVLVRNLCVLASVLASGFIPKMCRQMPKLDLNFRRHFITTIFV